MGGLFFALVLLGSFAFTALAVRVVMKRGREMRELAERGVAVTGTVVRRFQSGKAGGPERTKRITFRYRGPDGRDYERSASMTRGRWEGHSEGAPIELYCLPHDPGVSAEKWLVEQARDALAKKRGAS
jgi:hypothetical protein